MTHAPRIRSRLWLAAAVAAGGSVFALGAVATEASSAPAVRTVNANAQLNLARTLPSGASRYTGTATGAPFGRGAMMLDARLSPARAGRPAQINATFTLTTRQGRVAGRGRAPLTISGGRFRFAGPVTITSATGRFAGARAVGLRFAADTNSLRSLRLRLTGRVRF